MTEVATERVRWRRWVPWIVGAVGVAALASVLRGIDFDRFFAVLAGADIGFLVLVAVAIAGEQLVRAWKWRQLLYPIRPTGTFGLFGAIMAGYFANLVIPFGVGPIVRSWLVARREGLKASSVGESIMERTIPMAGCRRRPGGAMRWKSHAAADALHAHEQSLERLFGEERRQMKRFPAPSTSVLRLEHKRAGLARQPISAANRDLRTQIEAAWPTQQKVESASHQAHRTRRETCIPLRILQRLEDLTAKEGRSCVRP